MTRYVSLRQPTTDNSSIGGHAPLPDARATGGRLQELKPNLEEPSRVCRRPASVVVAVRVVWGIDPSGRDAAQSGLAICGAQNGTHAVDDSRPVKEPRLTSSPPAGQSWCLSRSCPPCSSKGLRSSCQRGDACMANRAVHPPILLHPGCMRAIAVVVLIRYLGRMKIDDGGPMSWNFGG